MYPGPLQLIRDVFILEYIYIVNTLWLNQHNFLQKKKSMRIPIKKNRVIKGKSSLPLNKYCFSHLASLEGFDLSNCSSLRCLGGKARETIRSLALIARRWEALEFLPQLKRFSLIHEVGWPREISSELLHTVAG